MSLKNITTIILKLFKLLILKLNQQALLFVLWKKQPKTFTRKDFEQVEELLKEMDLTIKNGDMVAATGELNAKLHNILYSPSERPQTLELIEILYKN